MPEPGCFARVRFDEWHCVKCPLTWDRNEPDPPCPLLHPPEKVRLNPLSDHARHWLMTLSHGAVTKQAINPGVVARLLEEALIELVELPSPFKTHKGRRITHAQITQAGRLALSGR